MLVSASTKVCFFKCCFQLDFRLTKTVSFVLKNKNYQQGKSEFIGRALAKPHVKLVEEPYEKPNFPPCLEWYDIYRGPEHAGELLATFEMLQVNQI